MVERQGGITRARRALSRLEQRVQGAGRRLRELLEARGVQLLDQAVSRLAGRPVHTAPRSPAERLLPLRAVQPSPDPLASAGRSAPPGSVPSAPASMPPQAPPAEPAGDASSLEPDLAADAELPAQYAGNRLRLLARDPGWGFVYWEIEAMRVERAVQALGGGRVVLRLADPEGHQHWDIAEVWPQRGRYHLRFPNPDRAFFAELVVQAGPAALLLARSNVAVAPPAAPRPPGPARFAGLAPQLAVLELVHRLRPPPRLVAPRLGGILSDDRPRRVRPSPDRRVAESFAPPSTWSSSVLAGGARPPPDPK